ncbi:MAG TPA: 16S rRNA (cytosine(1402)-N(4))-methyltransferase RsmH [Alphaproteobacteria bacterium]|nr:16S rRNA (cytosine(1402)-N(4))-methyltransferase RsmH [Alphaproteobacteria bacterium]
MTGVADHATPAAGHALTHAPVLLAAVLDALAAKDGATYIDGTFGAGGYARALLDAAACTVIGIDRDRTALALGGEMTGRYPGRLQVVSGCFGDMVEILRYLGIERVDGVALDLGVSSMQLDDADRGFSFRNDGPLDMRMGSGRASAADIVNTYREKELADLIYRYGEERASRRIARAIVRARASSPITRTGELADIVRGQVKSGGKKGTKRRDPATRTFQALRIHVNDELGELGRGLAAAETLLVPGGRLAVVSFHSLEDRIVKDFIRRRCGRQPRPSRHRPLAESAFRPPSFEPPARGVVKPTAFEVAANPRARSARMRAAVRTDAAAWSMPDTPGPAWNSEAR